MKKNLFILGMASIFALTGCHGTKKVEVSEFKEKADAAIAKAPEVDYTTYNGKYGDEKIKFSTNQGVASYSVAEAAVALALGAVKRVDATYSFSGEFYVGFGFKVVTSDCKYEYNGKGYLASVKGKINGTEYNFSVSHKYVK